MNLRELEYLVAVADERHFHRAAERCFVSQPTLSGQLKKLEEELGVLLVERTNRQVLMTEIGTLLADQARKILAEVRAMRDLAQTYQDPMAGQLHVGLIPTLAPYLLPRIIPAIQTEFPKLKLWLYEYQTAILLDKLRHAQLDVLILALPVDTDEFSEMDLFKEPFWLAVPRGTQLADLHQVQMLDLRDRELLLLEEGHCLRGQALDVCFMAGASENAGFHATSLETLRHMISEGMGMTLFPQLAVPDKARKEEGICYIPFSEPRPNRRIGLLYRKGSYREAAFTRLAEVIKQTISFDKS